MIISILFVYFNVFWFIPKWWNQWLKIQITSKSYCLKKVKAINLLKNLQKNVYKSWLFVSFLTKNLERLKYKIEKKKMNEVKSDWITIEDSFWIWMVESAFAWIRVRFEFKINCVLGFIIFIGTYGCAFGSVLVDECFRNYNGLLECVNCCWLYITSPHIKTFYYKIRHSLTKYKRLMLMNTKIN